MNSIEGISNKIEQANESEFFESPTDSIIVSRLHPEDPDVSENNGEINGGDFLQEMEGLGFTIEQESQEERYAPVQGFIPLNKQAANEAIFAQKEAA